MSFLAMGAVRTVRDISPTSRLVLYVLAQFSGADGVCHPSQSTVAEEAGLSERAVRNGMTELKAKGHIAAARRVRRNGSRTSDEVTLLYFKPAEAKDEGVRMARIHTVEGANDHRQDMPVADAGMGPDAACVSGLVSGSDDHRHDMPDANRQITSSLPAADAGPTTFEPVREYSEQQAKACHSERERVGASDLDRGSGQSRKDRVAAQTAWASKAPARVPAEKIAVAWDAAMARDGIAPVDLRRAVVACVASDADFGRGKAVALDRWLDEGRYVGWLAVASVDPAAGSAMGVVGWDGPNRVRQVVLDAMGAGAVASYLDTATWDGEASRVLSKTRWANDKLRADVGPALKAMGITIEHQGSATRG